MPCCTTTGMRVLCAVSSSGSEDAITTIGVRSCPPLSSALIRISARRFSASKLRACVAGGLSAVQSPHQYARESKHLNDHGRI